MQIYVNIRVAVWVTTDNTDSSMLRDCGYINDNDNNDNKYDNNYDNNYDNK